LLPLGVCFDARDIKAAATENAPMGGGAATTNDLFVATMGKRSGLARPAKREVRER
jgi:hypothetical protein